MVGSSSSVVVWGGVCAVGGLTPATNGVQPEREQGETHHRRIGVHIFSLRELSALTLGQSYMMMLMV